MLSVLRVGSLQEVIFVNSIINQKPEKKYKELYEWKLGKIEEWKDYHMYKKRSKSSHSTYKVDDLICHTKERNKFQELETLDTTTLTEGLTSICKCNCHHPKPKWR